MLVFGRNVALEIFQKNKKVLKIYLQKNFDDKRLNSYIEKTKSPIEFFDKNQKREFAKYNHQGILLDIEEFNYTPLADFFDIENANILILDHLEDPHNLGAIIRTVEASGFTGVIIPSNRSVSINSTVMKISAGALDNVKVAMVTNISQAIDELKKNGFWIVSTSLNTDNSYKDIDYRGKIGLVIGNEGKGVSDLVLKKSDYVVKIPMYGKTNSLNASVAAGILMFEVVSRK